MQAELTKGYGVHVSRVLVTDLMRDAGIARPLVRHVKSKRTPDAHARVASVDIAASISAPIKIARPDRYSQKMRIATPANAP